MVLSLVWFRVLVLSVVWFWFLAPDISTHSSFIIIIIESYS